MPHSSLCYVGWKKYIYANLFEKWQPAAEPPPLTFTFMNKNIFFFYTCVFLKNSKGLSISHGKKETPHRIDLLALIYRVLLHWSNNESILFDYYFIHGFTLYSFSFLFETTAIMLNDTNVQRAESSMRKNIFRAQPNIINFALFVYNFRPISCARSIAFSIFFPFLKHSLKPSMIVCVA